MREIHKLQIMLQKTAGPFNQLQVTEKAEAPAAQKQKNEKGRSVNQFSMQEEFLKQPVTVKYNLEY